MSLTDDIQAAIKSNKIILGYRESVKFLKTNSPKVIVVANNTPEKLQKEIKHNAKVANAKVEIFEGSSKDLGTMCGKPFPVSVLVIKG